MKKRNGTLDIARGIAIVCIVLGHLGNATINRIVYTFHVPIFFLIPGYFLSEDTPPFTYIKHRIRNLIIPYYVTCAAIIVIGTLAGFVKTGLPSGARDALMEWVYASLYASGGTWNRPFYIRGIGALWFLWATFWGCIIVKLLLYLRRDLLRAIILIIVFVVGYDFSNLLAVSTLLAFLIFCP